MEIIPDDDDYDERGVAFEAHHFMLLSIPWPSAFIPFDPLR